MNKKGTDRLRDYLQHILDAILRVETYTENMNQSLFLENPMAQDAIIRNLEIIGEASRNIERYFPEFSEENHDLPLRIAYEMRNALAHGYSNVDLEIVWKTVEKDIPYLKQKIVTLHKTLQSNN